MSDRVTPLKSASNQEYAGCVYDELQFGIPRNPAY